MEFVILTGQKCIVPFPNTYYYTYINLKLLSQQAAQAVLIALFQLNTPEFTMLLAALPKTFQDGATKLLQNHLKNTGNAAQVGLYFMN